MILLTAIWVYISIQSPFLVFCCYPVIRSHSWLASPKFFVPVVLGVSVFFFFDFEAISVGNIYFTHFLFAGLFALLAYWGLCFRWGYSRPDALVLSIFMLIGIDALWQIPFDALNWTSGLYQFEIGIVTAGWNLQSLPFLFYVVSRERRIRLGRFAESVLLTALLLTVFETWRLFSGGYPGNSEPVAYTLIEPYYLIVFWFVFFLALFRSSRSCADRATNGGDRSRLETV